MRNQPLTGYILYQKPYGESRSLIYFFSKEFGLVHGIGKKNLPLFCKIALFATGKNSLKTFSQSQVTAHTTVHYGKCQIAGLYMNELLLKLFGIANVENAMPELWQQYERTINKIFSLVQQDKPKNNFQFHFILREFETVLLHDFGYMIDFSQDIEQNPLQPNVRYEYVLEQGFQQSTQDGAICGELLITWQACLKDTNYFDSVLNRDVNKMAILCHEIAKLYQKILNHLLNYQPLKSRELWRQLITYQKDFS